MLCIVIHQLLYNYTDRKWALFVYRAFSEFTTILPDYILDRTMDKNHKKPAKPRRELGGHKIGGTKSKDQGNFIEWVYTQKTARNGPRVVNPKWEIVDGKVKRKWTQLQLIFLPTKSWMGYIFIAACLCVCLSVCLCLNACEQNSSRTDAPIWTQFLLNGCLIYWLELYGNWWPCIKGQGHSEAISIFSS